MVYCLLLQNESTCLITGFGVQGKVGGKEDERKKWMFRERRYFRMWSMICLRSLPSKHSSSVPHSRALAPFFLQPSRFTAVGSKRGLEQDQPHLQMGWVVWLRGVIWEAVGQDWQEGWKQWTERHSQAGGAEWQAMEEGRAWYVWMVQLVWSGFVVHGRKARDKMER